jgi:hypothetical protein
MGFLRVICEFCCGDDNHYHSDGDLFFVFNFFFLLFFMYTNLVLSERLKLSVRLKLTTNE